MFGDLKAIIFEKKKKRSQLKIHLELYENLAKFSGQIVTKRRENIVLLAIILFV